MTVSNLRLDNKDIFFIALLVIVSWLLAALYLLDYRHTMVYPYLWHSDSGEYLSWARDIAAGDIIGKVVFMKWPFYAYALAALLKAFKGNVLSVYLFQNLLWALSLALIYAISKKIFGRLSAAIASCLCAGYGFFIFYNFTLTYVQLSLLLNLILFLLLLRMQEDPGRMRVFFSGFFLGICALTQGNIIIFGLAALAWILSKQRLKLKQAVLAAIYFLAGLCLVLGAVSLRNYLVGKDFVLVSANTGINFYLGNNPGASGTFYCPSGVTSNQEGMFRDSRVIAENASGKRLKPSQVSAYWFRKAAVFIKQRPAEYFRLQAAKLMFLLSPREYPHDIEFHFLKGKIKVFDFLAMDLRLILPLGLLGIILGIRRFKEAGLLYLILFTLSLSIVIFFISTRYRIALVPYLAIFAGFAGNSLWLALKEKKIRRLILLILIFLALYLGLNRGITAAGIKKTVSAEVPACLLRAGAYETDLRYQQAAEELIPLQKLFPADPKINFRLGVVNFHLHNFVAAEENFKAALKANPLAVDAWYNLGVLYRQQLRFTPALEALNKAIALDPEDAGAYFESGLAYKSLGDKARAAAAFNSALKYTPRWKKLDQEAIAKELESLSR